MVGIDLIQNLILMGIWIGDLDSAYLFLFDAEFIGLGWVGDTGNVCLI